MCLISTQCYIHCTSCHLGARVRGRVRLELRVTMQTGIELEEGYRYWWAVGILVRGILVGRRDIGKRDAGGR